MIRQATGSFCRNKQQMLHFRTTSCCCLRLTVNWLASAILLSLPACGALPADVALTNASQQLGIDGLQARTTIKRANRCPAGLSDVAKAKYVLFLSIVCFESGAQSARRSNRYANMGAQADLKSGPVATISPLFRAYRRTHVGHIDRKTFAVNSP